MSELQGSSPSANGFLPHDSNVRYNFNARVVVASVAALFLVIFLILLLHIVARRCWPHPYGSIIINLGSFGSGRFSVKSGRRRGLDLATISRLPTFVWKSVASRFECPICLSEFQENEKGRTLPSCKHAFHASCIDAWLSSQSTCPVCRTVVLPPSDEQRDGKESQLVVQAPQSTKGNHGGASNCVQFPPTLLCLGKEGQMKTMKSNGEPPGTSSCSGNSAQIAIEVLPSRGSSHVTTASTSGSGRESHKSTCLGVAEQAVCSSQPPQPQGKRC